MRVQSFVYFLENQGREDLLEDGRELTLGVNQTRFIRKTKAKEEQAEEMSPKRRNPAADCRINQILERKTINSRCNDPVNNDRAVVLRKNTNHEGRFH